MNHPFPVAPYHHFQETSMALGPGADAARNEPLAEHHPGGGRWEDLLQYRAGRDSWDMI